MCSPEGHSRRRNGFSSRRQALAGSKAPFDRRALCGTGTASVWGTTGLVGMPRRRKIRLRRRFPEYGVEGTRLPPKTKGEDISPPFVFGGSVTAFTCNANIPPLHLLTATAIQAAVSPQLVFCTTYRSVSLTRPPAFGKPPNGDSISSKVFEGEREGVRGRGRGNFLEKVSSSPPPVFYFLTGSTNSAQRTAPSSTFLGEPS